jgi:hypothetical protein
VETAIWLIEVAPQLGKTGKRFLEHLADANNASNPELMRLALKLATGAGKTTVMAMIIAWQTINAVRQPGSTRFTRGFLVVTPGLTIRDRLRVLQPNDPDSYYRDRELVPGDMLGEIDRAKIVITNYHAFKLRERIELSKGGRSLLQGRGEELNTLETEGQMEDPYLLIIETCIATGARISEVLGLLWKHVNLDAGTIKIEQRVWHQNIDRPKSEDSKRTLGIGDLVERYRANAALHQAAEAERCDFPGLGPHSFRRANITWRQQVGGSAIEASKIAGHSDLEMTGEYTFVTAERQNELTRRIQGRLTEATKKLKEKPSAPQTAAPAAPEGLSGLADATPATTLLQ